MHSQMVFKMYSSRMSLKNEKRYLCVLIKTWSNPHYTKKILVILFLQLFVEHTSEQAIIEITPLLYSAQWRKLWEARRGNAPLYSR